MLLANFSCFMPTRILPVVICYRGMGRYAAQGIESMAAETRSHSRGGRRPPRRNAGHDSKLGERRNADLESRRVHMHVLSGALAETTSAEARPRAGSSHLFRQLHVDRSQWPIRHDAERAISE